MQKTNLRKLPTETITVQTPQSTPQIYKPVPAPHF